MYSNNVHISIYEVLCVHITHAWATGIYVRNYNKFPLLTKLVNKLFSQPSHAKSLGWFISIQGLVQAKILSIKNPVCFFEFSFCCHTYH